MPLARIQECCYRLTLITITTLITQSIGSSNYTYMAFLLSPSDDLSLYGSSLCVWPSADWLWSKTALTPLLHFGYSKKIKATQAFVFEISKKTH